MSQAALQGGASGTGTVTILAPNTSTDRTVTLPDVTGTLATTDSLAGYLFGLTLSTAGSSATMSIASGKCVDSAGTQLMSLSAIAKTTSAWSVGTAAGGLDTGAIANSTWYHFYVIRRTDTGVVDVCFSTNATTPTLPTNYTQYRRIGSGKTNGSAQWVLFFQDGDRFTWDAPVLDVNVTSAGTAAVSRTLSTPLGVKTVARLALGAYHSTSYEQVLVTDLATTDQALSNTSSPGVTLTSASTSATGWMQCEVMTNTSSQIRSRCAIGDASSTLRIITNGWIDSRGRNA